MRCEELREWVSAELDGEVRRAKRQAVREHLSACEACRLAGAAAETLRHELARAAAWAPPDEARDEMLLTLLRQEGVFREVAGAEPQRHERLEERIGGWRDSLCSLCLRGLHRLRGTTSLRPAAAALAVSFLLTWSSLRWAETGRAVIPAVPGSLAAAAWARPPDAQMLDQWMAGVPSLAALSRLQRLPAPAPMSPAPALRGAVYGSRGEFG